MGTSFLDIYNMAITNIDDPFITKAYQNNQIQFFKIMYNYLNNAIPQFNNPSIIQLKLQSRTIPQDIIEVFDGDGVTTSFPLSSTPDIEALYIFQINEATVNGTYNSNTNTITFSLPIPQGQQGSFEWYNVGSFSQSLHIDAQRILAKILVVNWAEKEKNFLLDIRRLLGDTDFKLNDASSSNRSKSNWYESMREESEMLMNQYGYNVKFNSSLYF